MRETLVTNWNGGQKRNLKNAWLSETKMQTLPMKKDWHNQHEWLVDILEKFYAVFRPRLEKLMMRGLGLSVQRAIETQILYVCFLG